MQEVCLRLMGKKLLVALAMEGKFAFEGLQAIDGDDDMLTAMARELVENKGIGESADSVWRALGQLRPLSPLARPEEPENVQHERFVGEIHSLLPLVIESDSNVAAIKAGSLARGSSRKLSEQGQLSLF